MKFREIPGGSYSEALFGYFDILGFGAFVKSTCENSPEILRRIFVELDFNVNLPSLVPIHLEKRIISDTIMLWSNDIPNGILPILNQAYLLQTSLMKSGLLVRGVIAKGPHYSQFIRDVTDPSEIVETKDEVIISPILIHCVEKEKKLGYPIIVIDESAHTDLVKASEIAKKFRFHVDDFESCKIVNGYFTTHEYLAISHQLTHEKTGPNSSERLATDAIGAARTKIQQDKGYILENLKNKNVEIRSKWIFIADRLNQILDKSAQYFPELIGQKIEL